MYFKRKFTQLESALNAISPKRNIYRDILGRSSSKMVWECPVKINELDKNNKVSMAWISKLSGIEGNETTNKLAKVGALTCFIGPEPFCGLGKNH